MYRLSAPTDIKRCAWLRLITTDRCNWLDNFNITKKTNWTNPVSRSEGPVGFGLTSNYCTDCSGCNSRVYLGSNITINCFVQNYIAVEFSKDVEMQSVHGNTTQESLSHILYSMPKYGACVMNSGVHDAAIKDMNGSTYVHNVQWYITLMLPHCSYVIWLDTTAPETDRYLQKRDRIAQWNDMTSDMIRSSFSQHLIMLHIFNASLLAKHDDNIHLHSSWYRSLNKLILHSLAFNNTLTT